MELFKAGGRHETLVKFLWWVFVSSLRMWWDLELFKLSASASQYLLFLFSFVMLKRFCMLVHSGSMQSSIHPVFCSVSPSTQTDHVWRSLFSSVRRIAFHTLQHLLLLYCCTPAFSAAVVKAPWALNLNHHCVIVPLLCIACWQCIDPCMQCSLPAGSSLQAGSPLPLAWTLPVGSTLPAPFWFAFIIMYLVLAVFILVCSVAISITTKATQSKEV